MSYTCLNYHIVFSTKDRRRFLLPDHVRRACEYIGGIIREQGGHMKGANGEPDHLHIAASCPAKIAVADFLRVIKGNSTKWIHEIFPELRGFGWQDGYAAFSVSVSVVPAVLEYIRGQAKHHQTISFQEELIGLLKKHGVEYDERYIWK